eukprot:CAMPEP_0185026638 /NCGR_PEP_ID=MMETSP1103-20130426/10977_1 /TAXON_ID=36769 /ORGANISM="Paraphysomonas bandaiensis, Strain Caron Lab Isolate" /LENGTH=696 /DNA_ID=CAMNT_0027560287 /DNA_START=242 /DNA_END=2332 /DNA_ORIENTATION=-
MCRRLDNLGDIVLDWEHSVLSPDAQAISIAYDKIDVICVCGDMKILPWDPQCFQLITLIHMSHLLGTPVLTCGSGAYAAVYTVATQGARFQVLNHPTGDSLENLKKFPRYFKGTSAYPCGWLDNETGDMYSYDPSSRHWKAVCNIGIYRLASNGEPTPARFRPVAKKRGVEHRLHQFQKPETPGDRDCLLVIRNKFFHHFALKNCKAPAIVAVMMDGWHFNVDGGLPLKCGMEVLGDGPHGPMMFQLGNSLHLAFAVDNSFSCEPARNIIREYLTYTFSRISEQGRLSIGLHDYIFVRNGGGITDSAKLSQPMARPLNNLPVRSRVSGGPTRVDPPVIKMAVTPNPVVPIPGSPRKGANPVPQLKYVRKPKHSRHIRLHQVISQCYGEVQTNRLESIAAKTTLDQRSVSPTVSLFDNQSTDIYSHKATRKSTSARNHSPRRARSPSVDAENMQCMSARVPAYNRTVIGVSRIQRPSSCTGVRRENNNRINWCNKWEDVRAVDGTMQKPQVLDEAGNKKVQPVISLADEVQMSYLPVQHPKGSLESSDSQEPVRTVRVRPSSSKPYSTAKAFERLVEEENMQKEYVGTFRGGYLTPYERDRKEYINSKKNFVGGTFKSYFGKASEIPLRQEGAIRPNGPFPPPIDYHKDKTYTLHGSWNPTVNVFSHEKEGLETRSSKPGFRRSYSNISRKLSGPIV